MSSGEWLVRVSVRKTAAGRWYWMVTVWGDPVHCGYARTQRLAMQAARRLARKMRRGDRAYGEG